MRKILLCALFMLFVFGLSAQEKVSESVTNFITKFETAVLTHNYDSIMEYMDAEYVKDQYKKLLKKDEEQFIDEFFGGYENIETSEGFTNTRLQDIFGIKLYKIKLQEENEYSVIFEITRVSGYKHYNQVVLRLYKNHLGFFGAMG
jgi:hypothetical protein